MPLPLWLLLSFLFSLIVILAVASVWFKDSPFSIQSIMQSLQETGTPAAEMIEVPNLVGSDYTEIEARTETDAAYNFKLDIYEEIFSDTVPAGQITTQLPPAGQTVEAGGTVRVAVSRGSRERTLPEIAGMTADEARTTLEREGFVMVAVDTVNAEVELGHVIGYADNAAGDTLAFGSVVSVQVSAEEAADSSAE